MSESQRKQAWITALRLLTATPKSSGELARKLREKGYGGAVVRETLRELEAKGVLSDRSYAQNIVAKYSLSQPSGTNRIRFELMRRRIPAPIREEALSILTPESEMDRAREIGLQRWNRFQSLPAEKRKKRTYDFLIRRGFSFDIVRELIEELSEAKP